MKKIKIIVSFLLLVLGISFLSSCGKESKPKIYMFHPEVEFSYIKFDIKVVEPDDVLIKEIYITLFEEVDMFSSDNGIIDTYSSKDGINKTGVTENVLFYALDPETTYRIDFCFDYYIGEYNKKNVLMYSYSFTTKEDTTGVSGKILNCSLEGANITFETSFNDKNKIITDYNVYLKSGNEIITSFNKENLDKNSKLKFGPLPPNKDYRILLCATFTYNEKEYIDLVLDKIVNLKTKDYSYYPTAEISLVTIREDIVLFDLYIKDDLNLLTDYSAVLFDSKDNIVSKLSMDDLSIGYNLHCELKYMYPNKAYTIKIIGSYKTPFETCKNVILSERAINTDSFDTTPTASISSIEIKDDVVKFKYSIIDRYDKFTDYSIILLDSKNKMLQELTKADLESKEGQNSFNLLTPKTSYKIAISVSYIDSNEVITNKRLVEEDFVTGEYSFSPTSTITHVVVNEDKIIVDYNISDSYSFLTALQCNILDANDKIIKTIDLKDKMESSSHNFIVNGITNPTHFKVQLLGTYSYLGVVLENEMIEVFEYKENAKEDFTYNLTTSGVVITKYIGTSQTCIIPKKIDNTEVITISPNAFSNTKVTSVIIPNSVTTIGSDAFDGCGNLIRITIPNSVTSIGFDAFYNCSSLEKVYYEGTIEDWCKINIEGLYSNPVYYANHFFIRNTTNVWEEVTSIEIPNTVTTIGKNQFCGLENVTSIAIPDSVTSIENCAFRNCSSLTSIDIPEGVTSIGNYAFDGCSSLTSITIPTSVTIIKDKAFCNCPNLKSVTIPSSVTSIGYEAFYNCDSLENVYYEGSIADWCNIKFNDSNPMDPASHFFIRNTTNVWEEVTNIEIPNTVTTIGESQFCGFENVISITIPNSVTSIGEDAFRNCSNLTSIDIPDGVTSIGYEAFHNCDSLTSIVIPASLTSIANTGFGFGLKHVYYKGTIGDWCNIQFGASSSSNPMFFASCFYLRNSDNKWEEVTSIEIPSTVTTIGKNQFYGFENVTSIILPNSVTKIDYDAFTRCSSLTSIIIPASVTSIGNYAFSECSSLTSIIIPTSITSIGDSTFSQCDNLTSITIPTSVTNIGFGAFPIHNKITIYYDGTAEQWNNIIKNENDFKNATIIFKEK